MGRVGRKPHVFAGARPGNEERGKLSLGSPSSLHGAHLYHEQMENNMNFSEKEFDAIIAGLRLLQCGLEQRPGFYPVDPGDSDVGAILTNSGKHEGLTVDEIDDFVMRMQTE